MLLRYCWLNNALKIVVVDEQRWLTDNIVHHCFDSCSTSFQLSVSLEIQRFWSTLVKQKNSLWYGVNSKQRKRLATSIDFWSAGQQLKMLTKFRLQICMKTKGMTLSVCKLFRSSFVPVYLLFTYGDKFLIIYLLNVASCYVHIVSYALLFSRWCVLTWNIYVK